MDTAICVYVSMFSLGTCNMVFPSFYSAQRNSPSETISCLTLNRGNSTGKFAFPWEVFTGSIKCFAFFSIKSTHKHKLYDIMLCHSMQHYKKPSFYTTISSSEEEYNEEGDQGFQTFLILLTGDPKSTM